MTRILHLVAANHRRGAETFAVELAEHHRAGGHEVRVLAVTDAGVAKPLPVEVAAASRADPRGFVRVLSAARWSDAVVSFGSSSLFVGAIAAKLAHRPFVYRNIGDPTVWGQARWANLRIGAPVRSAARVVALYPAAAEALVGMYHADQQATSVIPRGVPETRFQPASSEERLEARAGLDLDPERSWVAYVGALSSEKDPLLAVDALSHTGDEVGLVIAGDGHLTQRVASRAQAFGTRVRMLGAVSDVRPIYAAADALVLPSRTEGIPGAAVEAGMCALPVVAFAVGGVSSVVLDGETGMIVETRDPEALGAGLSAALAARDALGAAARAHCLENFSMCTVGRQWEELIAELV